MYYEVVIVHGLGDSDHPKSKNEFSSDSSLTKSTFWTSSLIKWSFWRWILGLKELGRDSWWKIIDLIDFISKCTKTALFKRKEGIFSREHLFYQSSDSVAKIQGKSRVIADALKHIYKGRN